MQKRRLGNSDLELSIVGLGTWAIGGPGWDYGWGKQDDRESISTIIRALESGINWVDTAAIYGLGHSEEIVGKAIHEFKGPVIVATKCGLLGDSEGHVRGYLKRESIKNELDQSLKRLKIDCVDLYQIHWPNPSEDIEEAFASLMEFKKQGKIRYAGVSNFSVKQMKKINAIDHVTSLQPPYSMLNPGIENEILPYCKEEGIGVIVYSPMQNGLLTEKANKEWILSLAQDDWRKTRSPYFQEPQLSIILETISELKQYSHSQNHTVAELSIAWTLKNPSVTAAIVGARKTSQIEETVRAAEWKLTEEESKTVDLIMSNHWEKMRSFKK